MEKIIHVPDRKISYVYNGDSTGRQVWLYEEAVRAGIYYHVCGKNFVNIEKLHTDGDSEYEIGDAICFPLSQLPGFIIELRQLLKDAGIDE